MALFAHWQASLRGVELLAAARPAGPMALTGEHIPARVLATEVSRELFPLLGAKAAAGRLFEPEDFTSRAERLVLSHQIWHRRWAGDPGVIGSRIKLGGRLWTITGVLSPSFVPPSRVTGEQVDIWLPLHREADDSGAWRSHSLRVIGRLGAGGTLESASADLLEVDARLAEQIPEHRTNLRGDAKFTALLPLKSATVSEVEGKLWMIWLAAAALLLIANANLAGFFLADGRERTQELKMRAVLGATSGRLLRQLLLEALVLAFLGGGLGLVLAVAGQKILVAFRPIEIPRLGEAVFDFRLFFFALSVAGITALAIGLAPAIQAVRRACNGSFAGSASGQRRGWRAEGLWVVGEITMTLVLLTAAVLMLQGFSKLVNTEPGFVVQGLTRAEVTLGDEYTPEQRLHFADSLLERLRATAGVTSAAVAWSLPFDAIGGAQCCLLTHLSDPAGGEAIAALVHPVSPGYFRVLSARLVRGRDLRQGDERAASVPVVINQALSQHLFQNGKTLHRFLSMESPRALELVVVGVVEDLRYWDLLEPVGPAMYLPYSRLGGLLSELRIVLRTSTSLTGDLAAGLRSAIGAIDPELPVAGIETLESRFVSATRPERFYSALVGFFAALAVLVTAVGIGASLLYSVSRREGELAVRLALGAGSGDLFWAVTCRIVVWVSLGLGVALLLSVAMSSFLNRVVPWTEPLGAGVFLGAVLLFGVVTVPALLIPALKAAGSDPAKVLKRL